QFIIDGPEQSVSWASGLRHQWTENGGPRDWNQAHDQRAQKTQRENKQRECGSTMNVYVTGMGVNSSLGNSVDDMFNGLVENRSGVVKFPDWKTKTGLFSHVSAPVVPYDIMKVP